MRVLLSSRCIYKNVKRLLASQTYITNVNRNISSNSAKSVTTMNSTDLQQEAMLNEMCFLVNENDEVIGEASKQDCHLVQNDSLLLHRAFSVFLFNTQGDLLLQKRASGKLTYPECYTNSCCSHPLTNYLQESDEFEAKGIKHAAKRRLNYELGIPLNQLSIEDFHYIARVHYKDLGDGIYGEHELDYILFIQKDVQLNLNPLEVSDIKYLRKSDVSNLYSQNVKLTPWFHLITQHKLNYWWDHLSQLDKIKDHENILRF